MVEVARVIVAATVMARRQAYTRVCLGLAGHAVADYRGKWNEKSW